MEDTASNIITTNKGDAIAPHKDVKGFLREYKELCKRYHLSIAHEDTEGAFEIQDYWEENIEWMEDAAIKVGSVHIDHRIIID